MNIAFTGHRDKTSSDVTLAALHAEFPEATWVHGGAVGFDSQVAAYAASHAIPQVVIRPNYDRYGRKAPLIRNRTIVDRADLLIACYDGRKTGGTFYTIQYAKRVGTGIRFVDPCNGQHETLGTDKVGTTLDGRSRRCHVVNEDAGASR